MSLIRFNLIEPTQEQNTKPENGFGMTWSN